MLSRLRPFLPWVLAIVLTVGSGAVAGSFSNRWGQPAAMSDAVAQLAKVPKQFGDWTLQSDAEIDPHLVEMLQCAGGFNRSYRNRRTGDTVHMAIVLGPPGPISVHTPEVCYSSQGYHIATPAQRISFRTAGAAPAQVWKTTFAPDALSPERLVAYYSWFDGTAWSAPDYARLAFGGRPYLFKLQLAAKIVPTPDAAADFSPGDDLLAQFYTALRSAG